MSRVILCTDFHLSFSNQFDRTNANGISGRLQEVLDSIKWAADLGKQKKCTHFFGLGDIFDKAERLPTKEGIEIQSTFKYVNVLYKGKCGLLTGNHDKVSDTVSILDLFQDSIKIFNQSDFVDVEDARIYFLPYTREPEDFYREMKTIEKDLDCNSKKYLLAHFWDNSIMNVDPEAIDLSKFNARFFDRIFCGHYHVPSNDLTNLVIYLGTLLNKRFSETGPKGAWILDTNKNKIEFIKNPHSPEFFSVEDLVIINSPEIIERNAYYRVYCNADTVMDISRLLSACKGFEILPKKEATGVASSISIDTIDKKNNQTLKEFVLSNCQIFTPEGITHDEFKTRGAELLSEL